MASPVTGYINVYSQGGGRRVSLPHASQAHADASAERVWRATGGECVRVDVLVEEVARGRLVEAV